MNIENLFKLYYLTWIKQNNIKVSYKNNQLQDKKDVHIAKKNELNLEDIKNYTKDIKEISSIKKYFKDTTFLDIWIEFCNLDSNFFKKETFSIIKSNINNIVDTLYYISGYTLDEYILYEDEDFTPIFSDEDFSIIGNQIGENLSIKNCLLILKKIDFELYIAIQSKVKEILKIKTDNANFVKGLWSTVDIKDNGKVEFSDKSFESLKELLMRYPNSKKNCLQELNDYYELLKLSKEKRIYEIQKLLFN